MHRKELEDLQVLESNTQISLLERDNEVNMLTGQLQSSAGRCIHLEKETADNGRVIVSLQSQLTVIANVGPTSLLAHSLCFSGYLSRCPSYSTYLYIYIPLLPSIYLYIYISISISLYLLISLYIYMPLSFYISPSISLYICLYLSIYLPLSLYISAFIYQSLYTAKDGWLIVSIKAG